MTRDETRDAMKLWFKAHQTDLGPHLVRLTKKAKYKKLAKALTKVSSDS